jgi:hypothetical protein
MKALSSPQALRLPSPTGAFTLATDASDVATGGALFQKGEPVWFFSQLLNKHERRLYVTENY